MCSAARSTRRRCPRSGRRPGAGCAKPSRRRTRGGAGGGPAGGCAGGPWRRCAKPTAAATVAAHSTSGLSWVPAVIVSTSSRNPAACASARHSRESLPPVIQRRSGPSRSRSARNPDTIAAVMSSHSWSSRLSRAGPSDGSGQIHVGERSIATSCPSQRDAGLAARRHVRHAAGRHVVVEQVRVADHPHERDAGSSPRRSGARSSTSGWRRPRSRDARPSTAGTGPRSRRTRAFRSPAPRRRSCTSRPARRRPPRNRGRGIGGADRRSTPLGRRGPRASGRSRRPSRRRRPRAVSRRAGPAPRSRRPPSVRLGARCSMRSPSCSRVASSASRRRRASRSTAAGAPTTTTKWITRPIVTGGRCSPSLDARGEVETRRGRRVRAEKEERPCGFSSSQRPAKPTSVKVASGVLRVTFGAADNGAPITSSGDVSRHQRPGHRAVFASSNAVTA